MGISAEDRLRMGTERAERAERQAAAAEREGRLTEALLLSDSAAAWRLWAVGFDPDSADGGE